MPTRTHWSIRGCRCRMGDMWFCGGTPHYHPEAAGLSGSTEAFSERACDLGTEIFRAMAHAGSGAAIASVSGGSGSAFDAVADGEDREAQKDGLGQAGGHLDVGAGGGQVLLCVLSLGSGLFLAGTPLDDVFTLLGGLGAIGAATLTAAGVWQPSSSRPPCAAQASRWPP
ncbi:hypothetical protein [Streptomyces sp. NPDC090798]|uniref:hypothetical protein n=1 Tax=Streptomyces sp. NPDC090798 TaxID=3365968 RepID=UPI0037FB6449